MSNQSKSTTTVSRRRLLLASAGAAGAAGLGLGVAVQPAMAVEQAKLMADTGMRSFRLVLKMPR